MDAILSVREALNSLSNNSSLKLSHYKYLPDYLKAKFNYEKGRRAVPRNKKGGTIDFNKVKKLQMGGFVKDWSRQR